MHTALSIQPKKREPDVKPTSGAPEKNRSYRLLTHGEETQSNGLSRLVLVKVWSRKMCSVRIDDVEVSPSQSTAQKYGNQSRRKTAESTFAKKIDSELHRTQMETHKD